MDVLSIMLSGFVGLMTLVVLYVLYMSKDYRVFRKMGVKALTPWPAIGNFPAIGKLGLVGFHQTMYNRFHNEKVYGFFEASTPVLVIRDLDMLREIMVKNFNCFTNRRIFTREEPIINSVSTLEGDHWRHVRNTLSPTFTSGKLKKMCLLVEETAKSLTSNLRKTCQEDKAIELKHLIGCYTMDVIANTGFGVSIDSLNDESSPFVREAKNVTNLAEGMIVLLILFPMIVELMTKLGFGILFPKKSVRFFNSFLDAAMENRKSAESNSQKRHDFVQLMAEEESKQNETSSVKSSGDDQERTGLSRLEAEIQEELDKVLAGKPPTYDNVNSLVYLDMCLNEGMRMYPPIFVIDRTCTQDCEVDGIKIPKGMAINFPFIAISNNPEYFPNPEEFDPERFTPENKASRHPFAFLPFGQGPRNCIGMRLALMEMKIALASVLQEMTPVPCSKSVYPPKLNKYQLKAEDGLWVKFVARKNE